MSDENHAETAETLADADSTSPANDNRAPQSNPSTATDADGNTVILNDEPEQTADIPTTLTHSNPDEEVVQK